MYQRLIPSLLLSSGRLVKGRRFQDFRDAGAPATTARAHNHQGADELSVCDIDASRFNQSPDYETLEKVAKESFMSLVFFGGINSLDRAHKAMMVGADKIGLTTTALDNSKIIQPLSRKYGAQAIVLGLDIVERSGRYFLYDFRRRDIVDDRNPIEWAMRCIELGCGEIRVMMVDQEGGLNGFDFGFWKELRHKVDVPILLEGGGGDLEHVEEAFRKNVDGVCLGSMLVFSDANLVKIKQRMISRNINIRP